MLVTLAVPTTQINRHARAHPRSATSATDTDRYVVTKNDGQQVERFQQTMKKWLRGQSEQPTTIDDLQALLDAFVDEYNDHRPHRSLEHRATPATVYTNRPKATPTGRDDTHDRVRHDKVDKVDKITWRYQGQMYSIGIGRTHNGTRVIVLAQDLEIRVIDAVTGELLRELVLDTSKRYQGTGRPAPPAEMKDGRTHVYWVRPSAMS